MMPLDEYFVRSGWTDRAAVRPAAEKRLRNGAEVSSSGKEGEVLVYSERGEFLGLGACKGSRLRLVKSFFEV